ncbi:MAG: hypothetical protein WCB31_09970 [Nitrososphaeraceae archaeon]
MSGSGDNTIGVCHLNNGSNIFTSKFDSPISAIAISKNKNIMTIGNSNGGVYAIDIVYCRKIFNFYFIYFENKAYLFYK